MSRLGWAVFALAFALLSAAAAPGLYLRDSGELTSAAFTLGIAHETGFPLFCLLGKAASLVPIGEVAFRLNLFSAAAGAIAAWLVYRLVSEATETAPDDLTARAGGAAAAALLVSGLIFFRASTVAEVYAPTAAALALALLLLHRSTTGDRAAGPLLALVGGLSLGLHAQLRILLGPAGALWALIRLRRGDRWPLVAPAALAIGVAVVAYLPLRAGRAPAADWADPRTLGAVLDHLSAARIRRAFAGEVFSHELRIVAEHLLAFARLVEGQLGVPALFAAAGGFAWLIRRRRSRALGVVALVLLISDALYSAWVNPMGLADFQDGAPTALAVAFAAGCGLVAAARLAGRAAPWMAGALAAFVVLPAVLSDSSAKAGLGPEAASWTRAALALAPPRALLLTASDDLSAGILYEQVVAGGRPDVTALVRQQLWDGALVAQRTRHAGGEVKDPGLALAPRERILRQEEILAKLLRRQLALRAVLWEPSSELPPEGALSPSVPLFRLLLRPEPLPPARPLGERALALLEPARDPLVRRLAAQALSALGRLYFERGDELRAGGLFELALGARPEDPVAATNLAVVRARRGDFAGARDLVERVLERDPERIVPRVNDGRYRLELGDLDGARAAFSEAHRRAPREPAALVGLARVALRRGERAQALSWVREALRLEPNDAEARALLSGL